VPDGRIILYGGSAISSTSGTIEDLAVLNTTKYPYEWIIPKEIKHKPTEKAYHTASRYGNYMIVAFGKLDFIAKLKFINLILIYICVFKGITVEDKAPNSEISILDLSDITTYKWIQVFKTIPVDSGHTGIVPAGIGIIVGVTVGFVGAVIILYLGYKFHKERISKRQISIAVIDYFY
jgi:hypothetical protein